VCLVRLGLCLCVLERKKHALDEADRAELLKETKRSGSVDAMRQIRTWLDTRRETWHSRSLERQGYVNGGGRQTIKQNELGILLSTEVDWIFFTNGHREGKWVAC
jgi:hypothetical protein